MRTFISFAERVGSRIAATLKALSSMADLSAATTRQLSIGKMPLPLLIAVEVRFEPIGFEGVNSIGEFVVRSLSKDH
jgi:hypothetical protein